ncbi:tetratricopeptide repeat protein [Kaarinaea lacus]
MNNTLKSRGYAIIVSLLISGIPLVGNASYFDQGLVHYSQGEYQLALEQFNLAVKVGEAGADYMLMKMHAEGHGSQETASSVHWALKAAESGIAQAQFQLAEMYFKGQGTAKDYQQAFHWYRQAAQQGYPLAMQPLARSYEAGLGVTKNATEAQRWYSIAASELDVFAQKGDAGSQNRLATLYEHGKGVKTNPQAALVWYQKAALQGLTEAQYNLGRMLAFGDVEHNLAQAAYWLQRAAKMGHTEAGLALAQLKNTSSSEVAWFDQL